MDGVHGGIIQFTMSMNIYRAEVTNNPLFIMFAEEMGILYIRNDQLMQQVESRDMLIGSLQESVGILAAANDNLHGDLEEQYNLYHDLVLRSVNSRVRAKRRIEELEEANHELARRLMEEQAAGQGLARALRREQLMVEQLENRWISKKQKK